MKDIDRRYKDASGLTERRFYSIFYSRIDPSRALVLGINPGGDPDTWSESQLASNSFYEKWEHEYVDCKYAIQEPMMPFLMKVFQISKDEVRRIPKSNLAFRRSNGVDDFKKIHEMTITGGQNEARPFVTEIIQHVCPSMIVLEGVTLLDAFSRKYCERGVSEQLEEPIFSRHYGSEVRVFCAELLTVTCIDKSIPVIAIGHPSRFGTKPVFKTVENKAREVVTRYV